MWPFSSSSDDSARLAQLFASSELTEVSWRESVDAVAPPGATSVDVVIQSDKGIAEVTRKVGLTYWPDGPVARGVQTYKEGTSLVFRNVPVKPGSTLVLASGSASIMGTGSSFAPTVRVEPSGTGQQVADQNKPEDPTAKLFWFAGIGIAIGIVLVAYKLSK